MDSDEEQKQSFFCCTPKKSPSEKKSPVTLTGYVSLSPESQDKKTTSPEEPHVRQLFTSRTKKNSGDSKLQAASDGGTMKETDPWNSKPKSPGGSGAMKHAATTANELERRLVGSEDHATDPVTGTDGQRSEQRLPGNDSGTMKQGAKTAATERIKHLSGDVHNPWTSKQKSPGSNGAVRKLTHDSDSGISPGKSDSGKSPSISDQGSYVDKMPSGRQTHKSGQYEVSQPSTPLGTVSSGQDSDPGKPPSGRKTVLLHVGERKSTVKHDSDSSSLCAPRSSPEEDPNRYRSVSDPAQYPCPEHYCVQSPVRCDVLSGLCDSSSEGSSVYLLPGNSDGEDSDAGKCTSCQRALENMLATCVSKLSISPNEKDECNVMSPDGSSAGALPSQQGACKYPEDNEMPSPRGAYMIPEKIERGRSPSRKVAHNQVAPLCPAECLVPSGDPQPQIPKSKRVHSKWFHNRRRSKSLTATDDAAVDADDERENLDGRRRKRELRPAEWRKFMQCNCKFARLMRMLIHRQIEKADIDSDFFNVGWCHGRNMRVVCLDPRGPNSGEDQDNDVEGRRRSHSMSILTDLICFQNPQDHWKDDDDEDSAGSNGIVPH